MKRLTPLILTAAIACLALMLATRGTVDAAPPVNPFAGSWAGTYDLSIDGVGVVHSGVVVWTISPQGVLRGEHDPGTPGAGPLIGKVHPDGTTMIVSPDGGLPSPGFSEIVDMEMVGEYVSLRPGGPIITVVLERV